MAAVLMVTVYCSGMPDEPNDITTASHLNHGKLFTEGVKPIKAVSFAWMKSSNRQLVLKLLRDEGPASRSDIARRTGLAPSAVVNIVGDLIAADLVCESGIAPSGGGRPPMLVAFHGQGGYVVGVNVGYSETVAVLTNLNGQVVSQATAATGPSRDWDRVRQTIVSLVLQVIQSGQVSQGKVRGVGIGVAGWVDSARGISVFSPNFGWRDVPVVTELCQLLELPVAIDNDVRMAALGEWRYGVGQGTREFACILVGSAVGAAFVIDGRVHHGASGTAGEIGHTVIDPDGPRCACGKFGCLEAMVSGRAIAAAAVAALKRGRGSTLWEAVRGDVAHITSEHVARHAALGDALSIEVIEAAGRYLGTALAMMVNLVNPELIAVGGGVSRAGDLLMEPLRESFRRHAVGYAGDQTRIERVGMGKLAAPIGAAEHVILHLLSTEQVQRILG